MGAMPAAVFFHDGLITTKLRRDQHVIKEKNG